MSTQVSYGESAGKAKTHAHGMAQAIFGDHPVASACFVAVLIIVILVLAFYLAAANGKSDGEADKMNGMHSHWALGSQHAGGSGLSGLAPGVERMSMDYTDRSLKCGPGERVTPMPAMVGDDGSVTAGGVYCAPESYEVDPNNLGCGRHWDPKANEEVAALYELGGLEGSSGNGEARLRHAIGYGEDGYTLSDDDRNHHFTEKGMKF